MDFWCDVRSVRPRRRGCFCDVTLVAQCCTGASPTRVRTTGCGWMGAPQLSRSNERCAPSARWSTSWPRRGTDLSTVLRAVLSSRTCREWPIPGMPGMNCWRIFEVGRFMGHSLPPHPLGFKSKPEPVPDPNRGPGSRPVSTVIGHSVRYSGSGLGLGTADQSRGYDQGQDQNQGQDQDQGPCHGYGLSCRTLTVTLILVPVLGAVQYAVALCRVRCVHGLGSGPRDLRRGSSAVPDAKPGAGAWTGA